MRFSTFMLGEFHYVFVWRFLLFQYHNYDSHSDDQFDLCNPISEYILSTIWHCWCSMMKSNHAQLLYYTHKFSNLIVDLNNLITFAVTTWQIYHLYSPNNWIRPIHMRFWCCNSVAGGLFMHRYVLCFSIAQGLSDHMPQFTRCTSKFSIR